MNREQAREVLRELDGLAETHKSIADELRDIRDLDYPEGEVLNNILLLLSGLVFEINCLETLSYHTLREESHGDEGHKAEA